MRAGLIIVFLMTLGLISRAQTITASPGWSATVSSTTITEAGLDYTGTVSSANPQTYVSFSGFAFNSSYTVRVHKSDINWNSTLILAIRRRTSGTGGSTGTISGSTANITLTSTPQTFYSGNVGNSSGRSNVGVSYRVSGRTVLIPAQTYTTNIVYTISN